MTISIEGYAATLQHLELLRGKRDALQARQAGAESQHLKRIGDAYTAGTIDLDDLVVAYFEYKAVSDPGYSTRWNAAVPVTAARVQARIRSLAYRAPSGPHGTWEGPYPFGGETTPGSGTSVVYVLFDYSNVPCYVGSTKHFRGRMNRHAKEGKQFCWWNAFPSANRAEAYAIEDRLLHEHKPYLNKRAAA